MAKSSKPGTSSTKTAAQHVVQWKKWQIELEKYHPQIDKNQEMYEFYKREGSETTSEVSMNTGFAIVESMISRLNDTMMIVTAKAHGINDMTLFERYLGNVLEQVIFDDGVANLFGPFRKIKEVFGREFLVKGNAVAEEVWCYEEGADGKTIADNPGTRVLPLKSVTFKPWMNLMTSDEYYVEKWMEYEDLVDGEIDPVTKKGLYTNLGNLKIDLDTSLTAAERTQSPTNLKVIVDGAIFSRQMPSVHILEHWNGSFLTVIANKSVIIREARDPFKTGMHPLITAIDYQIEGRPYGYGEIDPIYKPIRAQDTMLNQRIETINQFLRPTVFVDPNLGPDIDMVASMLETGGVGFGIPSTVASLVKQLPPSVAYTEDEVIQKAIERTARFSAYASGVSNSTTDSTQGTKGGIIALQGAAEPNFQVKIDGITDMFLKPILRRIMPMLGGIMGDEEVRYGYLQGEDRPWISATKNVFLGKPTLSDLHTIGMLTDAQFTGLTTTPILDPQTGAPPLDPQTGQPAVDPKTGLPPSKVIPGADKASMIEIDWIVDVTLDQKSAHDRQAKLQNLMSTITYLQGIGVHFSPARAAAFLEKKDENLKGLDAIILTPAEMQQQSSQLPHEQLRVNMNFADLPPEGQIQAASQAGITLTPGGIEAHQANKVALASGAKQAEITTNHLGRMATEGLKQHGSLVGSLANPAPSAVQSNA